jgi:nicotinamide riboside transporter PnuC
LDWVATALGLTGCILLGSGHRIGWLLYAMASGINAYLGFKAGFLGMAVGCTCYVALELRGWYNSTRGKNSEPQKKSSK